MFWGFASRPRIGELGMSLFFTWGPLFMTGDGPEMAKYGRLVNVQNGPKGTKMVSLSVFDHLELFLGPSGPLWTISDKN